MQFLLAITLAIRSTLALPLSTGGNVRGRDENAADELWELSQFHLHPFNLTHMCIECDKGGNEDSSFGCSIEFDWEDPNADDSCTCREDWEWDGVTTTIGPGNNHSTDYVVCKNERNKLFQFKFVEFVDLSNFSLSLTHLYKDTKNFPAPTMANMFSQPNITLQLITESSTSMTYSSADNPIKANITGMTI
ncbi:hypothetical protein AAE478_003448 [Parahypoxylon ruwenzoriense]